MLTRESRGVRGLPIGYMPLLRDLSLGAAIILVGMLLGAGVYESVVMAPNYAAAVPESLEDAKQFMRVTNPGNYFRVVAPLTQIALLITLVLNWRGARERRWWLLSTFVLAVAVDVITFTYHYPRNAILFTDPMNTPPAALAVAATEWIYGNLVRVCMLFVAMVCGVKAAMARRAAELS